MNKKGSTELQILGFDWLLWFALVLLVLWIGWRNHWLASAAVAMGIFVPMMLLIRIGIVKWIRAEIELRMGNPEAMSNIRLAENAFRILFILMPVLLLLWGLWVEFRP